MHEVERRLADLGYSPARLEEAINNEWLGLGDTSLIQTPNLWDYRTPDQIENPLEFVLGLMAQPSYFDLTCRHLLNKQLHPFQHVILRELWTKACPMVVASRGAGKSFCTAMYLLLRAIVNQGSKIVIVGAAFRQSKVVFDYIEDVWLNAPLLRDICSGNSKNGPRRDIDRCNFRVGESLISALPIGDGQKIRGQRANITLAEEFASIKQDVFENVVSGFSAVALSPVERTKEAARKRARIRFGLVKKEDCEAPPVPGLNANQTILSGTAYYSFNHMAFYHKRYRDIINSKGDKEKLEEIFGGDIPAKFDWRAFSVIRLPVELLPEDYMDESHVAKQKATLHASHFMMEYGACVGPDTPVVTDRGVKAAVDVEVGDMVLTHKGRFRPVKKVTCRRPVSPVLEWETYAGYSPTKTTADHLFYDNGCWTPLHQLEDCSTMARLQELSGFESIDLRFRVSNYVESWGFLYPRSSRCRMPGEDISFIRSSDLPDEALAERFGLTRSAVKAVRRYRKPKNSIPVTVPLDYEFGLVVGYYAAEGSVGANGKAVSFALDGHAGTRLCHYVDQLVGACNKTFGFTPKVYRKANVACVTINQRLVVDLIKSICPGRSHTKLIESDVLFSNREFLRGFVVGYWNGDGHLSVEGNKEYAVATCVNLDLLCQVRLALSYFGVCSSLRPRLGKQNAVFRGKEYKTRPAYTLAIHGNNVRAFKNVFYQGPPPRPCSNKRYCWTEGTCHKFKMKNMSVVPYDGLVYNLEVEEDNSYSLLNATVHNCFPTDSDGFFKRTLVESCVVGNPEHPIRLQGQEVRFSATTKGDFAGDYVIGVDPASEQDNLSVVILECHPDHRRIVYCWTMTRKRHKERLKKGVVKDQDFYGAIARKIRDLAALFPAKRIAMDSQGGGIAILEALMDPARLLPGELPFLPVIDPDAPRDTDSVPGHHLVEMVQFARADWVSEANHGMRHDFESKVLLFPEFNSAEIGYAIEEDKLTGRVRPSQFGEQEKLYDTLEDCVLEIEDLKDELATIVHTQVGVSMRDRWDVPESKKSGRSKLRKDRYSALLMANMAARRLGRAAVPQRLEVYGGFVGEMVRRRGEPRKGYGHHQNPPWYEAAVGRGYGVVARRPV